VVGCYFKLKSQFGFKRPTAILTRSNHNIVLHDKVHKVSPFFKTLNKLFKLNTVVNDFNISAHEWIHTK